MPWNLLNQNDILTVQKGTHTFPDATTQSDDTITACVKNKSILIFNYHGGNATDASQRIWIRGKILNSTTLRFNRAATNIVDVTIEWFVVEFKASAPITVQHGDTGTFTGTTQNESITAVNTSKAFPIYTYEVNGTAIANNEWLRGEITSSTNFQLTKSGASQVICDYQIIEYQRVNVSTTTISQSGGSTNGTISAVNMADTMIIGNAKCSSASNPLGGDSIPRYELTSTTNINVNRNGTNGTFDWIFYIVETNGRIQVQRDGTETIGSGNTTGTTTWTTFNTNMTALYRAMPQCAMGHNSSSTADEMNILAVSHKITNSTTTTQTRQGTGVNVNIACELWDFANA